jgi:hypothetical protein
MQALLTSPVLLRPDQDKPFVVVTDASDFAVGASLEQSDDHGQRRPVAFFSHSLYPAQRSYQTYERELPAIVLALRTWRHYLEGGAFTVECHTELKVCAGRAGANANVMMAYTTFADELEHGEADWRVC